MTYPLDEAMADKVYLGDAVYVEKNDYGITLTTENGICTTNTIHMEPAVLKALLDWMGVDPRSRLKK